MQLIYEAIIPIEPRTKKNSQEIFYRIDPKTRKKKPFIMPSLKYRQYVHDALYFLRPLNIDFPVNIKCLFYMQTRRRVDLTNLLEAIDDVMVAKGTIKDDNFTIIEGHDGSRVLYDKEIPRTEIYIYKL